MVLVRMVPGLVHARKRTFSMNKTTISISVDILAEMGHEDLKQIGVTSFGHRHKLIKGIEKLLSFIKYRK